MMKKVKVPELSFKHLSSTEAKSRTMLCYTSFSRVSLSIIPIEIPFGSWDAKGIEFLWIIKVHTSIWNDLQTTKGLGIRPPRPTTLTRPFRTSWKNPKNIQRTSREHLEKIWRKSNVQHLWSSEHILRASFERQKHLRTSENIYGTTENIWHHSENNWEPIIDSLNKISKFILKCCMEWDDYLRPNQFLHHLMIKGMILSPPRDIAPPVFPLAW